MVRWVPAVLAYLVFIACGHAQDVLPPPGDAGNAPLPLPLSVERPTAAVPIGAQVPQPTGCYGPISAEHLAKQFNENEALAYKLYLTGKCITGKCTIVFGSVKKVSRGESPWLGPNEAEYVVEMSAGKSEYSLFFALADPSDSDMELLRGLKPNQAISIDGICFGRGRWFGSGRLNEGEDAREINFRGCHLRPIAEAEEQIRCALKSAEGLERVRFAESLIISNLEDQKAADALVEGFKDEETRSEAKDAIKGAFPKSRVALMRALVPLLKDVNFKVLTLEMLLEIKPYKKDYDEIRGALKSAKGVERVRLEESLIRLVPEDKDAAAALVEGFKDENTRSQAKDAIIRAFPTSPKILMQDLIPLLKDDSLRKVTLDMLSEIKP